MSRTLNNDTSDNAGYLQGIPISSSNPAPSDVLQFIASTGLWTPEPVTALPSIQSVQNIGVGTGVWANTISGVASLKSLDAGNGISISSNSTDITISINDILPSLSYIVNVNKGGNDTTGDGSINKPFLTISHAMSTITYATVTQRVLINLGPGTYSDSFSLKANIFIVGSEPISTRLTGTIDINDVSWNNSNDNRSGFSDISLINPITFDFTLQNAQQGKIYVYDTWFDGLVTSIATNSINEFIISDCILFGGWTQTGVTSVLNACTFFGGNITVNSSSLSDTDCQLDSTVCAGNLTVTSTSSQHVEVDLFSSYIPGTISISGSNALLTYTSDSIPVSGISLSGGATATNLNALPSSTNIYNSDGTLSATRTVTLGGNELIFGPISATSPAQFFLDPTSNSIGLFSYNGDVNIGANTQTTTTVESVNVNLIGNSSLNLNSTNVTFPQQANGYLKTTSGTLSAGGITLENLSDVSITSPTNGQFLTYESATWENTNAYVYKTNSYVSGTSFTAVLDNIYISAGCTITIPNCGSGDTGRRILISASQSEQTIIVIPSAIFLIYNDTGYENFQINSPTGSVELIVVGSNQYTFASITDRWTSAILSFRQPFSSAMLNLQDLGNVTITSPTTNQILKYNGTDWINSTSSFTSNLIYSGIILSGSTLQHIYDYVTFMDITYTSNANVNMTICLAVSDTNDSTTMIWDIQDYINDRPGTWKYVQPRTLNNWTYYTYFLYIINDTSNINLFHLALQKGPSLNALSTNTAGYYFNIYNYCNTGNYSYNVYTNPAYSTSSGPLSIIQTTPRQVINNFKGTNLTGATLTFSYLGYVNYNIRFQVYTEVNFSPVSPGTLTVNLNGVSIYTIGYQSASSSLTSTTAYINICEFGDAMTLLNAGTLLPGSSNNLTFSVSSGNTTSCNYNVSVILSL